MRPSEVPGQEIIGLLPYGATASTPVAPAVTSRAASAISCSCWTIGMESADTVNGGLTSK